MTEDWSEFPVGVPWADGSTHGAWTADFNGYGNTRVDVVPGGRALTLQPQASVSAGETHAGLVTTTGKFGDSEVNAAVHTVQQLRAGGGNAWEVGWVLWHFTDDTHFYYFVVKPEGWELGKEDPAYPGAQRFLATDSNPKFPVGGTYAIRVVQVGATITVWVDGTQLVSFTDTERPYRSGSVGLYTEDAVVQFNSVSVAPAH